MTEDWKKFVEHGEQELPKTLIYLGTPYTHPDKKVRQEWACEAAKTQAALISQGFLVISPVALTCSSAEDYGAEPPEGWLRYCLGLLCHCDELWVDQMAGWEDSVGISKEIAFALGKGMPIRYFSPEALLDPDVGEAPF